MMNDLIRHLFAEEFHSPLLGQLADAADIQVGSQRLAITTDSFVVSPLFFPGGDIGELAVNGTINDLAAAGAKPLYLTSAFILEEGLPMEILARVTRSMAQACVRAGVQIAAGDTKVVNRGHGDGIYIRQDRCCTSVYDRVHCCTKRKGRGNNLITGFQTRNKNAEM
jgi:hydrogenase expression/formation protein HypE